MMGEFDRMYLRMSALAMFCAVPVALAVRVGDIANLGPTSGAPPAERGIDISGPSPARSTQDKT